MGCATSAEEKRAQEVKYFFFKKKIFKNLVQFLLKPWYVKYKKIKFFFIYLFLV